MILVNLPFTVTGKNIKTPMNMVCLSSDNGTGYEKNLIKNLDDESEFTVEDLWFDEEQTGRKIKYKKIGYGK